MKKLVLISILVVAMGVIGFVGCEREEIEKPTQTTNLRLLEDSITGYYQNEDTIRTPEDSTESSQNEDPEIIKGHVVSLLDCCIGNMMVVSVENDTAIGTNQDLYGNNCFRIYGDTLFVYNNVIGLPLPYDYYSNEYRYIFNGDTLRTINENDYFEFKCQPINSEEYSMLFEAPVVCPADLDGPSNMNLFKITEIKKYIKKL